MWFIDLAKLIYEAVTSGKIKLLLCILGGLGLSYGMWHFSKSVPDTAFFVLGLGILYGLISLPSLIKKSIASDHVGSEAYRDKISPIIRYLMNRTMAKLNADRSFVLEGHNGSTSLSNLSFLYMDITYLETNVMNDWISFDYRNLSTSIFPCFHYLSNEGCFTGTIEDMQTIDNKISHIVSGNGTKFMSIISLNNSKNKCVGAIAVTWMERPNMTNKEIEKEVSCLADKLERILTVRLSDKELNAMLDQ